MSQKNVFIQSPLAQAICLIGIFALPASAQDTQSNVQDGDSGIENVHVYGEQGETDTATKLNLTIFETPQTVTAISRAQIEDFSLNDVNTLLNYTPGITVEEVETDRTYYTARGFDIVNFQYDGVGIPFIGGLNLGQQDTAIYEKAEVIKGASGLITGLANPSATINYIRKRPTEETQASAGFTLSEWEGKRIDLDASGALSGRARARVVVAYDDSESYLDRHEDEASIAYGIIEGDITDSTTVTFGHSFDKSESDGVLWGALTLNYSDGTQADFDVSTSNAPDWAFADSTQNQSFVELAQNLNDNWRFNIVATHNKHEYESELFYVYGELDRETGQGLNGWASAYDRSEVQTNLEAFVSGDFYIGEQSHQLVAGYSYSKTDLKEASYSDPLNGFPVLGADWALGNAVQPSFTAHDPATQTTDLDLRQKALYFATRLNFTDKFSVLAGARQSDFEQNGFSYGAVSNADADKASPYIGATYKILDSLLVYGSYSEVFKQQTWVNSSFQPLGAVNGESNELGFKKTFNDERAVFSFSAFKSEQSNFGVFAERIGGVAVYVPSKLSSEGYELELAGEIVDGLNVGAGFTQVDIEGENGEDIRPFIPENQLKFSISYDVPAIDGLKLGGLINWQDDTVDSRGLVKQNAYALADVFIQYKVNENASVALNLHNITDEKYINSLYWEQGYYGAPMNASASLRLTY